MLNGYYDKIMFDEKGESNAWEGSSAQKYCTEYYRKLPVTVKDRVIGVRTTDTESGSAWLDVSNIDGTKTDKDKVFFLSFKEYDAYRTGANLSSGYKWLLRCPGTDCSEYHDYIGVVDNDGSIHNYSIEHLIAARPGFKLRLPSDICAVKNRKRRCNCMEKRMQINWDILMVHRYMNGRRIIGDAQERFVVRFVERVLLRKQQYL